MSYVTLTFYSVMAFSVLCMLLSCAVLLRSRLVSRRASTMPAVTDLLDYAVMADEHTIVLKSGALMAMYEIGAPDMSAMSENQVAAIYANAQKALLKLSENCAIHVDVVRNKDYSYVPEVESDLGTVKHLEQLRREIFARDGSYRTRRVLTITWIGAAAATARLDRYVSHDFTADAFDCDALQELATFRSLCSAAVDTLEAHFTVRPLGISNGHSGPALSAAELERIRADEQCLGLAPTADASAGMAAETGAAHAGIGGASGARGASCASGVSCASGAGGAWHEGLSFIHQCLTACERRIAVPRPGSWLDHSLGTCDLITGHTLKADRKLISVLAVEGLPSFSHEGMVNALAGVPFSCRISTRFVFFDKLRSKTLLSRYRAHWSQRSKSLAAQLFNLENARVNQNALDQMKEIDEAARALDNDEVVYGAYTATIILADEHYERLSAKTRMVIRAVEKAGLSVRVETINATDAFLGSLPGHFFENLRRPTVSQDVLLDLIPLSEPVAGESFCPSPLLGSTRSPLMQVRTAGQGRYLLNLHDSDLANTLVLGPTGAGKSVLLGSLMMNLSRYKDMRIFAFDKGCSFYALSRALNGTHITFDNSRAMLCPLHDLDSELDYDYALSFLELLFRLNGLTIGPAERSELTDCLHILGGREPSQRTLSDLHLALFSRHLKEALAPYSRVSSEHCILDGDSSFAMNSGLTVFECADIFSASPSFALPVLRHVFRIIEKQFDGRPAAIVIDEAWLMLKDEVFASELIKWFKTLRKFNAFVILATQSITDLQSSPHFNNLLECARTRFYLPNYDAGTDAVRGTYQTMGLSDAEISSIAQARPKQDYYFVKNDQRIMVSLPMSAPELALLSVAGDHRISEVNELYSRFGSSFYEHLPAATATAASTAPAADAAAANAAAAVAGVPDAAAAADASSQEQVQTQQLKLAPAHYLDGSAQSAVRAANARPSAAEPDRSASDPELRRSPA